MSVQHSTTTEMRPLSKALNPQLLRTRISEFLEYHLFNDDAIPPSFSVTSLILITHIKLHNDLECGSFLTCLL